jgi:hypothetical protein
MLLFPGSWHEEDSGQTPIRVDEYPPEYPGLSIDKVRSVIAPGPAGSNSYPFDLGQKRILD